MLQHLFTLPHPGLRKGRTQIPSAGARAASGVIQISPSVLQDGKEPPAKWSELGIAFDSVSGLTHV